MKIDRPLKLLSAVLGLTLMYSISSAQTTVIDYTNTFDNNGNTALYQNNWMYWYSLYQDCFGAGYNMNMTNDPSMDAAGDTNNSGSLIVISPFSAPGTIPAGGTTAEPSYGEQNLFSGTFGGGLFDVSVQMKILTITNISFDIHVLPGTIPDANGNFGVLNVGLKSIGYNADTSYYTNQVTIPGAATNGWVHLAETNAQQFQNAALNSGDTFAQGVEFYYTQYGPPSGEGGYPTNKVVFWIDNVVVNSSAAPPPPPPPPTVSIHPAVPGLNLFTGTGIGLYNRENIVASNANFGWVGASGPVSYSFTISDYPVGPNDAVQCQIFLCPSTGTENDPDWAESNIIFLDLESTTTGAQWNFRYKTNDANANDMLYNTNVFGQKGTLASISTNTALGTWTVTFNQNTNVTMTIPGGASTNFSIPDTNGATTALFASGVDLYFGVQAGNAGGANDHIAASEFKVTGTANDFDDNFITDAGTLNPVWSVDASYTNCIKLVAPGNPYWVQWTAPAAGFDLVSTPTLSSNSIWTFVTNNLVFTAGTNFTQLISSKDLPAGSTGYFALTQPVFSQLQVLLPGETAAPGTATGKTGTPTSETSGNYFYVTVNAVDKNWNLVSSVTDTIHVTSTDTTATLPADAPLVGGTGQFIIIFGTPGNFTVTATDVTDSTKTPGTSASVQSL